MKKPEKDFVWPPKHAGGRPRHFTSAKKLQDKVDDYFEFGIKEKSVILGTAPYQREIKIQSPTTTGLAFFLGFASRQSLYDYGKNGEFSYIIKRAALKIEQNYEEMLMSSTGLVSGPIFALKNMGWTDKTEIAMGGIKGGAPVIIELGTGKNPDQEDEITE